MHRGVSLQRGTCTLPSSLPFPSFPISLHHQASELRGVQSVTALPNRSSIQQEVGSIPTDPRVPYVELPRGGQLCCYGNGIVLGIHALAGK